MGCSNTKNAKPPKETKPEVKQEESPKKEEIKVPEKPKLQSKHQPPEFPQLSPEDLKCDEEIKDDYDLQQCFELVKTGNVGKLNAVLKKFNIHPMQITKAEGENVSSVSQDQYFTQDWNLYLQAIIYQQKDILVLLYQDSYRISARESLRHPYQEAEQIPFYDMNGTYELFGLSLCINQKNLEIFQLLWENLYNLWSFTHLKSILDLLQQSDFQEGIEFFFKSYTVELIISSISLQSFNSIKDSIKQITKNSDVTARLQKLVDSNTQESDLLFQQILKDDDSFIEEILKKDIRRFPFKRNEDEGINGTPVYYLLKSFKQDLIVKKLKQLKNIGLCQSNVYRIYLDGYNEDLSNEPFSDGGRLLKFCIENNLDQVLKYILSDDDFYNFWRWQHLKIAIDVCIENNNFQLIQVILSSSIVKGIFSSQKIEVKYDLIKRVCSNQRIKKPFQDALTQSGKGFDQNPYCTTYLIYLSNREVFKKIENYDVFKTVALIANALEVSIACTVEHLQSMLVKFIKYIVIQDPKSQQYKVGMQAISQVYEKVPSLKSQIQLQQTYIGEESDLIDEDQIEIEIQQQQINTHKNPSTINMQQFNQIFSSNYYDENEIKAFYEREKQVDLLFIKFPSKLTAKCYTVNGEEEIPYSDLSIIQIAADKNLSEDLLLFFSKDYHTLNTSNQQKYLPDFFILLNKHKGTFSQGATLLLKFLISNQQREMFQYYIEDMQLWTAGDLYEIAQILLFQGTKIQTQYFSTLINSAAFSNAFKNSSMEMKRNFESVIQQFQDKGYGRVYDLFYEQFKQFLDEKNYSNSEAIAQAINDDNAEYLESLISNAQGLKEFEIDASSIPDLSGFGIDEQTAKLTLNGINLSVLLGKPYCLSFFISKFNCLRQAFKGSYQRDIFEISYQGVTLQFESIGFAYLAISKNQDVLVQLLKNSTFVPSHIDFKSFTELCLLLKWNSGLQLFLQSYSMQIAFASYPYETQKQIVAYVLNGNSFIHAIVKRPYIKHSLMFLMENPNLKRSENIAEEALKNITTQDFQIIIYYEDVEIIKNFKSNTGKAQEIVKNIYKRIRNEILDI